MATQVPCPLHTLESVFCNPKHEIVVVVVETVLVTLCVDVGATEVVTILVVVGVFVVGPGVVIGDTVLVVGDAVSKKIHPVFQIYSKNSQLTNTGTQLCYHKKLTVLYNLTSTTHITT
jgi:hypothetical protein